MKSLSWFMCRHVLPPAAGGAPTQPLFAAHLADRDPTSNIPACGTHGLEPIAASPSPTGLVLACVRCLELSEVAP